MRAIDTLAYKLAFDAALDDPGMHTYFDEWLRRDPMARRSMPASHVFGQEVVWNGRQISQDFKFTLSASENFYVDKEVATVVSELAKIMPPEVLRREDLPSSQGWLMFEEPFMLNDIHSEGMPVRGIMWSQREVGREDLNQKPRLGIVVWAIMDLSNAMIDKYYRYGDQGALSAEFLKSLVRKGLRLVVVDAVDLRVFGDSYQHNSSSASMWRSEPSSSARASSMLIPTWLA